MRDRVRSARAVLRALYPSPEHWLSDLRALCVLAALTLLTAADAAARIQRWQHLVGYALLFLLLAGLCHVAAVLTVRNRLLHDADSA